MRRLFYFPLEPYKERYTLQLSASKTGWLERQWTKARVDYHRIEGQTLNNQITIGSVLDANGRGYWACSQIMNFLKLLNSGQVTSDDCLYFDDFWHPGISALPYSFHLSNIKPKMFAFLFAQSVDKFDFTYSMRKWMRHFEKGIGKILDGIFVASTDLRNLCVKATIGTDKTVYVCGLPYDSQEVKSRFPKNPPKRQKQVIFTSRWDREKCPWFFLEVIDELVQKRGFNDIRFIITTSAKKLRSNNQKLLKLLGEYLTKYPKNLFLKENLTKEEYYSNLLESKVQFNCSDQDWVAFTLLESTTCGCNPVYPNFLSFPEALQYRSEHLYNKDNVQDAADKILLNLSKQNDYSWVYKPFDQSWRRMLNIMEGRPYENLYCY